MDKKARTAKFGFAAVAAVAALLFLAAGLAAFSSASNRDYAEAAETAAEPYAAKLAYAYDGQSQSYRVTGVDTGDQATAENKPNLKIVVPAIYDDNTNGEHPVTEIWYGAFDTTLSVNSGYVFASLDLTAATNLKILYNNAFSRCSRLTGTLTIPSSVTRIESGAFSYCSGFTGSLVIPDSVTYIGEGAFSGCSGFDGTLTLPNNSGFTTLKRNVFGGCSGFTGTLAIPDSVTAIADGAFLDCSGFAALTLSNSLTTIGESAFRQCGFQGSLAIPDSVTSIGDSAFLSCADFNGTLTLSNSLQTIGSNAFQSCSKFIGALRIPSSVREIKGGAFAFCGGIQTVYLPANAGTTYGATSFKYMECPVVAANETLYRAYKAAGHALETIVDLAFEKEVTFHGGGGTVGGSATLTQTKLFDQPIGMEKDANGVWTKNSAYAPPAAKLGAREFLGYNTQEDGSGDPLESGAKVGNAPVYYAQYGPLTYASTFDAQANAYTVTGFTDEYLRSLTETEKQNIAIVIPAVYDDGVNGEHPVTAIGDNAFYSSGYSGYTFVSLDMTGATNLKTIENSAFRECSGLAGALAIPDGVTSIGTYAFYRCSRLTSLTLPDGLTELGEAAFSNCTLLLGTLKIPASLTAIPLAAFQACSGFQTLILPDTLRTIGKLAFSLCWGFKGTLTIPLTVTEIADTAFQSCTGFTRLDFSPQNNSLSKIGKKAFYQCSGFEGAIKIPGSVAEIGADAFHGCSGLKTVDLPDNNATTYGAKAFETVTCPVVTTQTLFNRYKADSTHALFGMNNLTYELRVVFEANGGAAGETEQTKLYHYSIKMEKTAGGVWAESPNYRLPTAAKADYRFTGWNSVRDGSGPHTAAELLTSSINTDTPLTYYAQYAEILTGISITSQPVKTEYNAFDAFDTAGMVITASYQSGNSKAVDYTVLYANGENLRAGDASVTISHTDGGITKTVTVSVTVSKIRLNKPTVSGSYVYSGEEQTAMITGVDGGTMTVSNDKRTNAGKQNVAVTLKDATNYEWKSGDSDALSLEWTIAPETLTITANDLSVVYGAAIPDYSVTYEGFVNSETADVLTGTLVFNCGYTQGGGVNTYSITPGGPTSDNYDITFVAGTLTVTKKSLTITANNLSVVYGAAIPEYTAAYDGFVNGEGSGVLGGTLAFVCGYAKGSGVNTYTITPGGPTSDNYDITFVEGTLTVTKKSLTITANNLSVVYGAAIPEYTAAYDGFVNGEGSGVLGGTLAFVCGYAAGSGVNTYAITPGGPTSDNYDITFVEGTLTVTQRVADLLWSTIADLVYDGGAKTARATVSNLYDNDICEVTVKLSDGKDNINAGKFTFTATALSNSDYILPENVTSGEYVITPATIEKPAADTTTFTYNGSAQTYTLTENAAYTISNNVKTDADTYTVTVSLDNPQGFVNYEWTDGGSADATYRFVIGKKSVVKPAITGTYTYSGSDQTANVVTTTEYTVTGNTQKDADTYIVTVTLKANYKWSDNSETALELAWTIAQKKLSITPSYDASAKVFVGGSLPAISAAETTAGTIAWDEYSLTEAATGKAFGWTWTPADTKNYEVVPGSVEFDVLAVRLAEITAAFDQGENKIYASDSLESLKTYLTVTGTNNDGSDAGTITGYALSGTLTAGGTVTITVSVGAVQTTFQAGVTAVALESITAAFAQGGNVIYASATLDSLKTYLTVTGTNNDGSAYSGTIEYELSGTLTAGTATITVTADGKTDAFVVTVTAVALESISAAFEQGDNAIYTSATLDSLKAYLTVTGTNNDGSDAGTITNYELSGNLTAGTATITVTADGKTAAFDAIVTAVELASITATFAQGDNKIYPVTPIDTLKQWLTVTGTNNDGTDAGAVTDYTLSFPDGATEFTLGNNTITVTVKDTRISTTFHNVTVSASVLEGISVTTRPTKTAYTAFEDFDAAGMVVTATFSHGAEVITGYTVANGTKLQAGTTTITISYARGEVTKTATVSITVAKIQLGKPTVTGTYTYSGGEQTVALEGFDEDTMRIVSGNTATNAGGHAVVIALADAANYAWKDGATDNASLAWTIVKASYDMGGVTFGNVTFKADGSARKLEVAGLPSGVTVTYSGTNGYTADGAREAGVYIVTATFAVADAANYNIPEARTATLTINQAQVSQTKPDGETEKEVVVVESENGLSPDVTLSAKDVTETPHGVTVADKDREIKQVYEISLLSGGAAVQPDGAITIRLLIAENLRGESNLTVYHVEADGQMTDVEATREGDYMVFTVTSLSKFAIVGEANGGISTAAIIGISIGCAIFVLFVLYILGFFFLYKKNKMKGKFIDGLYLPMKKMFGDR